MFQVVTLIPQEMLEDFYMMRDSKVIQTIWTDLSREWYIDYPFLQ